MNNGAVRRGPSRTGIDMRRLIAHAPFPVAASTMNWSMRAESVWAALSVSGCLKGSTSALSACSARDPVRFTPPSSGW